MRTKTPGLAALERKVADLGLREQAEEELAQILIEHNVAQLRKHCDLTDAALKSRPQKMRPRDPSTRPRTARPAQDDG